MNTSNKKSPRGRLRGFKNTQLYQLTLTQFLETVREPSVLFWGIVFPILISIGLGLAFTQTSEAKFHIALVEKQPTKLDSLLTVYAKSSLHKGESVQTWTITDKTLGNTELNFHRKDWNNAIVALKRGEADVILTDSAGQICYRFDPHNSQAQLIYMKLSYLMKHPSAAASLEQGRIEPLTLKGVRYIDFLIPGLITLGILNALMWGISYAIIERRSQKLLRRMVATPMKKSNFLIAMMLVRFLMNIVEAGILFFFSWLFFGIVIQGNIGALLTILFAGNVAFAGLSVLIATRASKTEVGQGWINAVTMPMMILSGIFFSYHGFPEWSIKVIKLLPLTALTDGVRSIFNEGAGWLDISTPTVALSAFGVICFILGLRFFKWG
jgi:ABC-type multidrug transport system permease subunit